VPTGIWSQSFEACRLHPWPSLVAAFKPAVRLPSNPGSFDKALWPQAFGLRALKPAVCVHGPLLLGRSSLPFARPQTPKMFRGSFDNTHWQQAFGLRALKPAVCLHGPLLLWHSRLPFARPLNP